MVCADSHLDFFADRTAVLATMHRKETVMVPLLEQHLGLKVAVPSEFNTDQFGTFSREIKRMGNQLEAARLKATAAMDLLQTELGLASEGSFGPHPSMPFLPCNRELVMLIDQRHQLEWVGEALSTQTNYRQTQATTWEDVQQFARQVQFPSHGLVVIAAEHPEHNVAAEQIQKGITSEAQLLSAFEWARQQTPIVWIETDMRALYNPSRMQVIQQATENLVAKLRRLCPSCSYPGLDMVQRKSGLPCGLCGQPTALTQAVVYGCQHCGFQQELLYPDGVKTADPTYCEYCNP
jgi:ribosomal protein S27AE